MSTASRCALALALAVGGCAVGPDFKRPPPPATNAYLMQGDKGGLTLAAAPAGVWWRAFGSDKLDAVMTEALQNNNELVAANATLAEARAQESAEAGGALPQVDATAGAQRTKINTAAFGFSGFPSPTIPLYSIGASVGYDLDLFGGRKRRIEGAGAHAQAEERRAEAAYLTLTGRVARQAFQIAALRAQLASLQAVVESDRSNLDLVTRAERAGGQAHTTTQSASAQYAQDLARVPGLQKQLAQARHGLALLVGRAPAEWSAPDFDLADFAIPSSAPQSLPSELVRRRPDILAAEADLHQATADVGVATAALFPNINLAASLTQTTLTTDTLFSPQSTGWAFGANLAAPIFHGGTLRAQRRASKAAAARALANYRQTVLQAFVQVADVMEALARDDEEINALRHAEQTSTDRLKTARLGFREGGLTYLDVLDAQRQNDSARSNLADAQGRRLQDFALLYVAVAADWRGGEVAAEKK